MSDFPVLWPNMPTITPGSDESIGIGTGAASSVAWPAANRAYYIPFQLWSPFPVRRIFWANGTVVSGNVDAGIFASEPGNGAAVTRLYSTGSTAQAGTSVLQSVAPTAFILPVGAYYLTLAMDNTTATAIRWSSGISVSTMLATAQQSTAFPLPASGTLARITTSFIPLVGITSSTVI